MKKSVLPCFCYMDFYLKEEKLTELSCVRLSWGVGQAAKARVSSPPGGKLPRPRYLTPHPFLFREKWLMVDIMNIQMTVQ